MRVGLPAYFYPWPGDADWNRVAALEAGSVVVLDPADGPGRSVDPNYLEVVRRLQDSGAVLLGYVDTAYARRDLDAVLDDARRFREWYGVTGVFLDRVLLRLPAHVEACGSVAARLRADGARVALNPGQPDLPPEAFELADHVVVFEGRYDDYLGRSFPPVPPGAAPDAVWHLVHAVATLASMREVVRLAATRGADLLLVTERTMPSPWDGLPAYWSDELDALTESTGV